MRFNRLILTLLIGGNAVAADSIVEVIALQHRPAAEILPLLQPLLGSDQQVVDNGYNLIVKTEPSQLPALRQLIAKLDIRQRNLLISVIQDSIKSADQLNADTGIAITPGTIRMQGYNADTRHLADERNMQYLRTQEGQPAHIEAGQQRPIENAMVYRDAYGYPTLGYSSQQQQASTGFAVIPRLTGRDEVVLDIEPWSEHFLRGGGMEIQNANTRLRTHLGYWVEIAGTSRQQQSSANGYNGYNHLTRNDEHHLVLKVELSD